METKRSNLKIQIILALGLSMFLSACTYGGGGDQPAIRKFTWFSYVAGDDIQQRCRQSQTEEYRFVYNAVYNEQVRTYDVTPAEKGRYQIKIGVTGEADLSTLSLKLSDPDLFQPWRPKVSTTNISLADVGLLKKTLQNADFFDSVPPSENIHSISFYWVISACVNGKFHQNAYVWPEEKFKRAQFGKLLSAWDFTDIPINPPRETDNFSVYGTNDTTEYKNHFNLRFGSNGLLRHTTIN